MGVSDDPLGWDDDPFAAPAEGAPAAPRVLKVFELTREIRGRLEALGRVSVEGELARVTTATSGHVYFDLKDLEAKLSCTIWRSQVKSAVRFQMQEGQAVVAHGHIDVYAPRGTYSLIVQRVEPAGLGTLLAQLEALKQELKALGWFDRHRPLPRFPRTVGIVTSKGGAALQDFLRTRSLRWPLYPLRLAHSSVQGQGAAQQIAQAIRRLDASGVDVIVVCRGGGPLEDLWCFNERPVLEAVRAASVPVVSGIGHESDTTLCDLVADHRAHTPTDAAQTVIPERAALLAALQRGANHLAQAADAALGARRERLQRCALARTLRDARWLLERPQLRLEHAARNLAGAPGQQLARAQAALAQARARLQDCHPRAGLARRAARLEPLAPRLDALARRLVAGHGARLDQLAPRLALLAGRRLAERALRLEGSGRALQAVSPLAVLARGYSITRRAGQRAPLTDAAALATGERLETLLAHGRVVSLVEAPGTHAAGPLGEAHGVDPAAGTAGEAP